MATANTVSIFVKGQFPDFFNVDGKDLVKFIEYYYEWLESYENPIYVSRKLLEYKDVDTIPDKFFEFIREEFMKSVPVKNLVDDRLLLKSIKDFYRAKGTEKAFKLLFRVLYNEEIDFYYPGQDMLRASAGKWVVERSIKSTQVISSTSLKAAVAVKGSNSGATARIDRISEYVESFVSTTEIFLNNIFGVFEQDEILEDAVTGEQLAKITSAGLITYPGAWSGTDGFLSWDKYLQDNFYYQEFSYVIKSNQNVNTFREPVTNLVHPAGTKFFGQLTITDTIDYENLPGVDLLSSVELNMNFNIDIDAESSFGYGYPDIEAMYVFELGIDPTYSDTSTILIETDSVRPTSTYSSLDVLYTNNYIRTYYGTPLIAMGAFTVADFDNTPKLVKGTGTTFGSDLLPGDVFEVDNPSALGILPPTYRVAKTLALDMYAQTYAIASGTSISSANHLDRYPSGTVTDPYKQMTLPISGFVADQITVAGDFIAPSSTGSRRTLLKMHNGNRFFEVYFAPSSMVPTMRYVVGANTQFSNTATALTSGSNYKFYVSLNKDTREMKWKYTGKGANTSGSFGGVNPVQYFSPDTLDVGHANNAATLGSYIKNIIVNNREWSPSEGNDWTESFTYPTYDQSATIVSKVASNTFLMLRDSHDYNETRNRSGRGYTFSPVVIGVGTIDVLNASTLLADYYEETLGAFGDMPLDEFTNRPRFIKGTGTAFTSELEPGDTLEILNSNGVFTTSVELVVSDTWMVIADDHAYGTVTGKTYKYY